MNGSVKRTLTAVLAGAVVLGSTLLAPVQATAAGPTWEDGWCYADEGVAVVVDFSSAPEAQWPAYAQGGEGWEVRCITPAIELTRAVTGTDERRGALSAAGFTYRTDASGLIVEVEGVEAPADWRQGYWRFGTGTIPEAGVGTWDVDGDWKLPAGTDANGHNVNRAVSVVLTGTDATPPAPPQFSDNPESPFTDINPGDQFFDEVAWLAYNGITTGWEMPDGTRQYRPLNPIARDAMAAYLYRLAGEPQFTPPSTSPFRDVPPHAQFYKEITWLASVGITTGWPDGTYRPLDSVNRDAMAAFLYRFAGEPQFTPPAASPFRDVTPQAQFYTEMAWLAAEGVSTGWPDGSYRPLTPVARDAMAAFLYRLAQLD